MFGFHRRKREKKRKKAAKKLKEQQQQQQKQDEFQKIENTPAPSKEEIQAIETSANELAAAEKERLDANKAAHKEEAIKDLNTPMTGVDPKMRQAMQESANMQIGGHLDNYSKMLASSQGSRGVRGGKAQADLRRQALNAQGQVTRDLNIQDVESAQQKLAAYLGMLEGKTAQDVLTKQQYLDLISGEKEKKKNSAWNTYYNKYFSKV